MEYMPKKSRSGDIKQWLQEETMRSRERGVKLLSIRDFQSCRFGRKKNPDESQPRRGGSEELASYNKYPQHSV